MSVTVISDRERIAREALEMIAARGLTKPCPTQPISGMVARAEYQCPVCKHAQQPQGPCLNRVCLTAIANKALNDLRRAS